MTSLDSDVLVCSIRPLRPKLTEPTSRTSFSSLTTAANEASLATMAGGAFMTGFAHTASDAGPTSLAKTTLLSDNSSAAPSSTLAGSALDTIGPTNTTESSLAHCTIPAVRAGSA